jgi:hypothetical protein
MPDGQIEAARLDVPLSPAKGRMLLRQVSLTSRFLSETCVLSCIFSAQVNLNKLFPKGYISTDAPKRSAFVNITFSRAFHTVRPTRC